MEIYLPSGAFLGNLDPFIRGFNPTDESILKISSHPKWFWLHPLVLSMVASLGQKVIQNNGKISCDNLESKSKHYLERMGLFKILNIDSGIKVKEHESTGRFIPLTKITSSKEATQFLTEMIPLLHQEPDKVKPIWYILSELIDNVLEHSDSKDGAMVCAQFYTRSNTVRIGVSDCGIGIKKSINFSHTASTNLEAIKLALTPGITGKTKRTRGTELNAGAGLFFIKSIAKVNRDFFVVYSGNGLYKLKKTPPNQDVKLYSDPFLDNCSKHNNFPFWQGAVVGIDLSLSRHQKFDILLDLIHEIYRKDIKARTKIRFKKAKFV